MDDGTIKRKIRRVLAEHGALGCDLSDLTDEQDLYAAGMTSFASVNVMLELEETFGIEFPDRLLKRAVFATVASIGDAVVEVLAESAA